MVYADSGPQSSVEAKGTRIASASMHAVHIKGFKLEAIPNIQLDAVGQGATARQSIGELPNQRPAGVHPESMMQYSGTASKHGV
jgi:NifU-like protein involved in Fe-S cluster formation